MKSCSMVNIFSQVQDFRVERTKKHKLVDVIVIAICAMIAGAEGFNEVVDWGKAKYNWLRKFLDLRHGIPSHDTFNRVFANLSTKEFEKSFFQWVESANILLDGKLVAIDGKTIRRSFDKKKNKKALHLVSAWTHEANMSLGQIQVDEKSNEITAIPELLKMLDLAGAIVTLDAMGCQKKIAKEIVDKKAGYVLALKKNHGDLHNDVETYFTNENCKAKKITFDKDHGRIEKRIISASSDIDWLSQKKEWSGLKTIVEIQASRETIFGVSTSKRYFLTTIPAQKIDKIAYAIRNHWSIENSLHWTLDVIFHEDQSRVRNDNAVVNLAIIRKMIVSMLRRDKLNKKSLRRKRFQAALDESYIAHLIGLKEN